MKARLRQNPHNGMARISFQDAAMFNAAFPDTEVPPLTEWGITIEVEKDMLEDIYKRIHDAAQQTPRRSAILRLH